MTRPAFLALGCGSCRDCRCWDGVQLAVRCRAAAGCSGRDRPSGAGGDRAHRRRCPRREQRNRTRDRVTELAACLRRGCGWRLAGRQPRILARLARRAILGRAGARLPPRPGDLRAGGTRPRRARRGGHARGPVHPWGQDRDDDRGGRGRVSARKVLRNHRGRRHLLGDLCRIARLSGRANVRGQSDRRRGRRVGCGADLHGCARAVALDPVAADSVDWWLGRPWLGDSRFGRLELGRSLRSGRG